MALVQIEHANVALNPEYILRTVVNTQANTIEVVQTDRAVVTIKCEYGKSIFKTHDDLVATLNNGASPDAAKYRESKK